MSIQKRLVYMGLGAFLALSIFVGAFAAFAQSGEEGATEEGVVEAPIQKRPFGGRGFEGTPNNELLADALGISVEELQTAFETAAEAALQQAIDEGLVTEDQAEALSARIDGFRGGFGFVHGADSIDFAALLAEALDISVEELQEARAEVQASKLAELVEAGVITQEEADMMLARQAVQSYVDQEAIRAAIQAEYETAVEEALEAGDITDEQAAELLENGPSSESGEFGIGTPRGRGFQGPGGGRPFRGGPGSGPVQAPFFNGAPGA